MSTEWITEVLRDLIRFAQQNRMQRLTRDLEQAMQGLDEERRNSVLPEPDGRSGAEEDSDPKVSKQRAH